MPRYPDFICIGAQKSATTWLFQRLSEHPAVWVPPSKELHYFDHVHMFQMFQGRARMERVQTGALRGIQRIVNEEKLSGMDKMRTIHYLSLVGMRTLTDEWYGRVFETARAKPVCGEFTPEYALLPDSGVEHIVRLKRDVKIIFLMRDPIDRAWSSMRMSQSTGHCENAQKAIQRPNFLRYSDYMATIERYRRFVLPENLLLLYFDDVTARPRELLEQVCEFLGISLTQGKSSKINDAVYAGQKKELDPQFYSQLIKMLAPVYESLLALENPIVDEWYCRHFGAPSMRYRSPADLASATPGD